MYTLEGKQLVLRTGPNAPGRVIAEVPSNGDLEGALLLVSRANLAARDEALLDQLGEQITTRNDVPEES